MSTISSFTGDNYRLIVTIVKKGVASKLVAATKKANIGGGTILLGKGTANAKTFQRIFGIDYEPEKEVVFSLVKAENVDRALEIITEITELDKPGKGIAFVLRINSLAGLAHLFAFKS
ncbi:MAG: P-II family nitrogen regulator [Desulfitobacteriia bacterium]|jgi:nitrogen regulatory protein P-II 1